MFRATRPVNPTRDAESDITPVITAFRISDLWRALGGLYVFTWVLDPFRALITRCVHRTGHLVHAAQRHPP